MATLRSRILEFFSPDCLRELNKVRKSKTIFSTNEKIKIALGILDKYEIDYIKLGDGTNRVAVLIDNYVFKIAMDDEGWRDNRNEYIVSPMAAPYVIKAYETNSLITVYEYVTLMSAEDYAERADEITDILEKLSEEWLHGDIGYIKKNYQNWGFRTDGKTVILDYAYMYKILTHMIKCHECGTTLYYNSSYSELICPNCGKKHSFWEVRKKIGMDRIDGMIADNLHESLRVTKPLTDISDIEYMEYTIGLEEEEEASFYSKSGRKKAMEEMRRKFGGIIMKKGQIYSNNPYASFANLRAHIERNKQLAAEQSKNKVHGGDGFVDIDEDDGDSFDRLPDAITRFRAARGLSTDESPKEIDSVYFDDEEAKWDDYSDFVNNFHSRAIFQDNEKRYEERVEESVNEEVQEENEMEEVFDMYNFESKEVVTNTLTPEKLVDDIISLIEGDLDQMEGLTNEQAVYFERLKKRLNNTLVDMPESVEDTEDSTIVEDEVVVEDIEVEEPLTVQIRNEEDDEEYDESLDYDVVHSPDIVLEPVRVTRKDPDDEPTIEAPPSKERKQKFNIAPPPEPEVEYRAPIREDATKRKGYF